MNSFHFIPKNILVNGELQHFKKCLLGTQPFQIQNSYQKNLQEKKIRKNCSRNFDRTWCRDAVEKSRLVEATVKQTEDFRANCFNTSIDQNNILDRSRIPEVEIFTITLHKLIYSPNLYIIIMTYPYIFLYIQQSPTRL